MIKWKYVERPSLVAVYFLLVTCDAGSTAQGRHLPTAWDELDTPSFVEAARLDVAEGQLDEATESQVRQNAKARLLAVDAIATGNLYNIRQLFELAKPTMKAQEIAEVQQRLSQRDDDPSTLQFWEMQSRVELLEQLSADPQQSRQLACDWCDAKGQIIDDTDRGKAEFNPTYEEALFHYRVRWLLSRLRYKTVNSSSMTATWTGTITAPRSGQYVFSATPINPSFGNPGEGQYYYQSLRVTVGNDLALDAKWPDWKFNGEAIALEAGTALPIVVEFSHSRKVGGTSDDHTSGNECPVAMLYWSGPGIARQLVPANVLTLPDGSGPGLLVTFRSTKDGQSEPAVLSDPRVDHVWLSGICVVPKHPQQQRYVVDAVWQRYSRPEFIEWCQNDHHLWALLNDEMLAECLSHEQRRAVVQTALDNPDLLTAQLWQAARQFFMNYRFDDPGGAMDVLGRWMVENADESPELSRDYFTVNLLRYRALADALTYQYPDHKRQLEDNYLVTDDGRCVLPAAYTLAFSYLISGPTLDKMNSHVGIEEWVAKLDERLADKSLTGERRVNWLLARATAQEIRNVMADRHSWQFGDPSRGLPWVEQAVSEATDQSTKVRAQLNQVVRLAVTNRYDEASQGIAAIAADGVIATNDKLTEWKNRIDTMKRVDAEDVQRQQEIAQEAYRRRIEVLRDQAARNGDSVAAQRFGQILDELPSGP